MEKNSFTLFETLLSMTILIIIVSGFLNSSYYDEEAIKTSSLLNSLENKFTTDNFSALSTDSKRLTIIKNDTISEEITVSRHYFENANIKIFKYEK